MNNLCIVPFLFPHMLTNFLYIDGHEIKAIFPSASVQLTAPFARCKIVSSLYQN